MTVHQPTTGLDVELTVAERNVELAFNTPTGHTLGLLGPNGSGKTTALLALAGWLIPDTGHAQLDNTVLFHCPDPQHKPAKWVPAADRGIGYLSQDHQLFPHLSAAENIMYGMTRAGITGRKARKAKAAEWLARVGLDGYGKRKPHQLSGGQAQRVAIARVLASGPRLVLLDEPLAALDVTAAPAIRDLLAQVLHDLTVVLVTHHYDDVDALADRVYRINPADTAVNPDPSLRSPWE